jgi:hypothetical protein
VIDWDAAVPLWIEVAMVLIVLLAFLGLLIMIFCGEGWTDGRKDGREGTDKRNWHRGTGHVSYAIARAWYYRHKGITKDQRRLQRVERRREWRTKI